MNALRSISTFYWYGGALLGGRSVLVFDFLFENYDLLISPSRYHLTQQGNHVEAEKFYQEALKKREEALGDFHPEVAADLSNLAGLFTAQVIAEWRFLMCLA